MCRTLSSACSSHAPVPLGGQEPRTPTSRRWTPNRRRLALGASTIYNVILEQRDLAQAQSAEVTALSSYSRARVQLDMATGETLRANNITVEEAFQGEVKRPPSPLPVAAP